jgi:hypothetical protein
MNRFEFPELGDEDLVAATSAGLFRRAQREQANPSIWADARWDAGGMVLQWSDGVECRFDARAPLRGECSCPSPAICRHLVRSVLHLRGRPELFEPLPESSAKAEGRRTSGPPPIEELLSSDRKALVKFLGKSKVQKAERMLAGGVPARLADAARLEVEFPTLGVRIRFPSGGGASFSVCTCSEPPPCSHVAPALLVLRGNAEGEEGGEPPAGAASPDLDDAMRRTTSLLDELVRMGLDGLSLAWSDAAFTTALEIRKLGFGAPAELLEQLGRVVEAELARKGQPEAGRLRSTFAALYLRCRAWSQGRLAAADDDLIARPARAYWTAGPRTLVGVGVRAWWGDEVSGIVLYLVDLNTRRIVSTGTARPNEYDFSPAGLAAGAPILGGFTAREILGGRLTTSAARLAADGAIRIPSDAICELAGAPARWDVLLRDYGASDWSTLADKLLESFPTLESLHRPVVHWFAPRSFAPARLQVDRQTLVWPMIDAAGRTLQVVFRYRAERARAFEALRVFAEAARPIGVLGSLRWTDGEACVEPITFVHLRGDEAAPYIVDIDEFKSEGASRGGKRVARRR